MCQSTAPHAQYLKEWTSASGDLWFATPPFTPMPHVALCFFVASTSLSNTDCLPCSREWSALAPDQMWPLMYEDCARACLVVLFSFCSLACTFLVWFLLHGALCQCPWKLEGETPSWLEGWPPAEIHQGFSKRNPCRLEQTSPVCTYTHLASNNSVCSVLGLFVFCMNNSGLV